MRSVRARMWIVMLSAAIVCGVAVVALLTHHEEALRLWESLTHLPTSAIAGALTLIVLQVTAQALRLWAIIPRSARVSVSVAAHAFTLGECANNIVPGRGGDVVKAVLINRRGGGADVKLSRAAGALLADKVIDGGSAALLCLLTGAFGVFLAGARAALPDPWVAGAAAVMLACVLLMAWFHQPAWLRRIWSIAREVVSGLSALKAPGSVLASVAFSVTAWLAELLALRMLCVGLGFMPAVPQLVLTLVVLNAGILVPISLANVGVYEAALAFGLTGAGIPLHAAVAIAIAHHALELFGVGLVAVSLSFVVRISQPGVDQSVPLPCGLR